MIVPCQYFVGYYESKLFQITSKPKMYYRHMDDTFVVFSNEDECNLFLDSLNSLLFALLLKKNLTWIFLSWTRWLKNLFRSLSLPSTENPYSPVTHTYEYSEHITESFVAKKIKRFHALPKFRPEKCPVYLCFPWLVSVSTRFEKQVKSAVKQCFSVAKPRFVCSTNELLSFTSKNVLPALQKSNVIY